MPIHTEVKTVEQIVYGGKDDKDVFEQHKPAYAPPDGTLVFQPHHELITFWPAQKPESLDWLAPYEKKHLQRFGEILASIFQVPLIDDAMYSSVPEDLKATCLFCCLTRGAMEQVRPSYYEWFPLVVVVKYCVFVAIRCSLDVTDGKFTPRYCLVWDQTQYIPILNSKTGSIDDASALLQAIENYATEQKLI